MAEQHTHDHEHEHGPECNHGHDHEHDASCCGHGVIDDGPLDTSNMDVASRSLAEALRLSFRVLTLLMIGVLIAFAVSGFSFVDSGQVGVKKVFGRVTGTSPSGGGLTYTWPYPVGEIELVDVRERQLQIKDFWMLETGLDAGKDMSQRTSMSKGLQPVLDGALFTGDRNLIHARIDCRYRVTDPVTYLAQIAQVKSSDILAESDRDKALEQVIGMAVSRAAIREAAQRTAQNLKTHKGSFEEVVRLAAQQELDAMLGGSDRKQVVVVNTLLMDIEWPVQAQPAYVAADQARKDFQGKRNDAIRQAREVLNQAAGDGYARLVGTPWRDDPAVIGSDANFIGQYQQLREEANRKAVLADKADKAGDSDLAADLRTDADALETQAREVLERIDNELMSNRVKGQASTIIARARAELADYIQAMKGREDRLTKLLPEYEKSPEMLMDRLWRETWDQIQSSPMVLRQYLPFAANARTVIQRGPNPDHLKAWTKAHAEWEKTERARKARLELPPSMPPQ